MIQNVELAKVDSRTINVLTFPLDRRKVAKAQEVTLPKHLSLDNGDELSNSNLSLCLNDVSFPLSVVANSFGTGKYITVKIIDPKVKNSCLSTREKEPIKAFISATESELQECFNDESNEKLEQSNKLYEDLRTAFSHCEEKLKLPDYNEETVCTIKNLVSIINMFDHPLSYETCISLNKIIVYLQTYLTGKEPLNGMNENCDHNAFHSISFKPSSFTNGNKNDNDKNRFAENHSATSNSERLNINDSKISITNSNKVIRSESIHKVTLSSDISLSTSAETKVNKDLSMATHIKEPTKKLNINSVQTSLYVSIHSLYQCLFMILQEHFRYKIEHLIDNIHK